MNIDFKKIIKSAKVSSIGGGFGVRSNSKRDLGIVFFFTLVLIVISAVYSFGLFTELDEPNNFFNDRPENQQNEVFADVVELKEKLELFKEENGCLLEYSEEILNIDDPSL